MIVVSNASPLISLSRIGRLDLLPQLFGTVNIAEVVFAEVTIAGAAKPAADVVARAEWLVRNPVADASWFSAHRPVLGLGELHTIALAQGLRANLVLIDERRARRLGTELGLKAMGCVGLLEAGFQRGLVVDLRAAYRRLESEGTFVSRRILDLSLTGFGLPPLSWPDS